MILQMVIIKMRKNQDTVREPRRQTYMLDNEPKTFKEAMSTPEAPFWK